MEKICLNNVRVIFLVVFFLVLPYERNPGSRILLLIGVIYYLIKDTKSIFYVRKFKSSLLFIIMVAKVFYSKLIIMWQIYSYDSVYILFAICTFIFFVFLFQFDLIMVDNLSNLNIKQDVKKHNEVVLYGISTQLRK